jgi:hypothetical protein
MMKDRTAGSGANEEPKRRRPTQEEFRERLDKISSIFSDMVQHADTVSQTRCPYKNRFSQCTAKFGCRHQERSQDSDVIGCNSDDKLDYRTAWEMNPEAEQKMSEKLRSGRTT